MVSVAGDFSGVVSTGVVEVVSGFFSASLVSVLGVASVINSFSWSDVRKRERRSKLVLSVLSAWKSPDSKGMLLSVACWALSPVIMSVLSVDACGFSAMPLIVGVVFLLRMKLSRSSFWETTSGLLSSIELVLAESSILDVDDVWLVVRRFVWAEGEE